MKENEEGLFDGVDFGNMFTMESEEPIEDTEDNNPEDEEKEESVEESAEDQQFVADVSEEESEEDDSEDQDTESDDPSDESKNSSSSSNYQVFAKALYDEGVITSFDEDSEIEGAEGLVETIKAEIEKQVEERRDSLPDVVKEIIERYEDGVDLGEFLTIKKQEQDFSKITEDELEDNEELSKSIIKRDLLNNGYTEEEADDEIEDIVELGKAAVRSKRSLKRINKKIEQEKAAIAEHAKAERKANEEAYRESLRKMTKNMEDTKEIAGLELTGKQRKDALRAMTEVVGKVGNTPVNAITQSRMKDPIEFDKNVSLLWTITKGFTDWAGLQKTAKRKAIKTLEEQFENTKKPAGTTNKRRKSAPSGSFYPQETIFSNIKYK